VGQKLISIHWYSDLGLVTCRTRLLSFEDFKRFAKVLSARLGLTNYKLGQAKDGFFIWSANDVVHKGILTIGIAFKTLSAHQNLIRKRMPLREFVVSVIKILSFFKKNPKSNMSLSQLKNRLQKSIGVVYPICRMIDEILPKFINQKEVEELRKKLIEKGAINNHGIVSFDKYIDVLCEGVDSKGFYNFLGEKRVCLLCGGRFIPEKGNWALYCPSCRRGPKKIVKMRIHRHPQKDEIRSYLDELKNLFDIDEQKEMILKLHKKFPKVFNPTSKKPKGGRFNMREIC